MKSFTLATIALIGNAEASKVKGWVNVDLAGMDVQKPRVDTDFNLLNTD